MEESLATFHVSLTEALMESTEKMMWPYSEPIDYSRKEKEHERLASFLVSLESKKWDRYMIKAFTSLYSLCC